MGVLYEKCRDCEYACRCCSSHFMEKWPRCSDCPRNRIEFIPAAHVVYCPLDGVKIQRIPTDVNGMPVKEKINERNYI